MRLWGRTRRVVIHGTFVACSKRVFVSDNTALREESLMQQHDLTARCPSKDKSSEPKRLPG